uniref:hypothetical protein n=1 Tax=Flavobacterium sp. TaxID=239 RepID=UPI00404B22A2
MKNINLCLCLLFTALTTFAQNVIKESHVFNFDGNVETMKVAPGGMLLVGTSDGLSAIEAQNKNIVYQYNALGKIKPEEMELIPEMPYVILTRSYTKVILNYFTGKEVFNSSKGDWTTVFHIKADFTDQRIYMLGTTKNGFTIGAFDPETFESKGMVSFSDKKTMGSYIDVSQYYESDGKIFVRTEKGIACVDKKSMKLDWAYDDLDKVFPYIKVLADASKGLYFVTESDGNKSYLHKIDNSGTRTTKKPVKLEAKTQALTFTTNGLLVQMMDTKNSYFQMYNPQTAENIWEKPADIKGSIFLAEQTGNYYIYASNDGLINSLDFATGKTQLKKEIKTGMWFKNLEILENDVVFYITSTNMGMANLKTGKYVKEPVKFKKATNLISAYDEKNDQFVVSTGTELYFIKKDGATTKIADLEFEGDETPTKIEFRDSGILLGAKQNNLLLSYDGKIIYKSYYKAPGQSLAAKIALGALTVAAASAGNASTDMGYGKRNDNLKGANGAMGEISKRFSATKETKNFLFVLTKLDDGVGLVKLNKDDGSKISELLLKDKKPEYEVDDLFGALYFKNDKKQITSFDLR